MSNIFNIYLQLHLLQVNASHLPVNNITRKFRHFKYKKILNVNNKQTKFESFLT